MAAIVGAAGLPATLAAARRGVIVAFANKETLVCAGPLMMKLAAEAGAQLLPVDSEHNAIWQVFDVDRRESIFAPHSHRLGWPVSHFVTRGDGENDAGASSSSIRYGICGAKISIDSATLMNKALEIIEAHFLFHMPSEKIDVLVHPQSVIHSMVEYEDGSVLAQMGTPDMRTPIGYTLAWPERMATPAAKLDLAKLGQLTFENPDPEKIPGFAFCARGDEKRRHRARDAERRQRSRRAGLPRQENQIPRYRAHQRSWC